MALWAAGGDRCQDLTTLRDFLEAFHVEELPVLHAGEKTVAPEESAPVASVGGPRPTRTRRRAVAHVAADRHAGCGCDDAGSPQAYGDGSL